MRWLINGHGTSENMVWRIIISAVGLILIIMALGNLLLFIWGSQAQASISPRRYGGELGAVNDSVIPGMLIIHLQRIMAGSMKGT